MCLRNDDGNTREYSIFFTTHSLGYHFKTKWKHMVLREYLQRRSVWEYIGPSKPVVDDVRLGGARFRQQQE